MRLKENPNWIFSSLQICNLNVTEVNKPFYFMIRNFQALHCNYELIKVFMGEVLSKSKNLIKSPK